MFINTHTVAAIAQTAVTAKQTQAAELSTPALPIQISPPIELSRGEIIKITKDIPSFFCILVMPILKEAREKIMQRAKISKENMGGQTAGVSDKIATGERLTSNKITADFFGSENL
jgi:hypothetical protein